MIDKNNLKTYTRFQIIRPASSQPEMLALLLLSLGCLVTVNVNWLFLTVLWVGLQFVIVIFSDHTHILLDLALGL